MKWKSIEELPTEDGSYFIKCLSPGGSVVKFIASFGIKDIIKGWHYLYPDHALAFPWPYTNVQWLDESSKGE